ncbi:MAG: serine/threonine protein kinase [Deltaproteobacteria bacterium]|nr:serine/threonine protein kinase [Deltaproteobacteria bacterium]
MKELTLPRQLGPYRLVRLLGRGGFGSVYEAEKSGPMGFVDRVALKLVDPKVARETPMILDALADEASILSRLRHPNIVDLRGFESFDTPDLGRLHGLVLEFVDGLTLFDLVKGGRRLSFEEVLYLFSELLDGLSDAHEARSPSGKLLGLVHRDLKPANLMIDAAGKIRILDFGIAFAADRRAKTAIGMTKGSPPFMSPEQVQGRPLDRRSDLYVVGVNLFDLVSESRWVPLPTSMQELARAAFSIATTKFSDRAAQLREDLLNPDGLALDEGTADQLVALLSTLLALDPADRPADAGTAMDALEALAFGDELEDGRARLAKRVGGHLGTIEVEAPFAQPKKGAMGPNTLRPEPRTATPSDGDQATREMDAKHVAASHTVARDLASGAPSATQPEEESDWLDEDIGSLATWAMPTGENEK